MPRTPDAKPKPKAEPLEFEAFVRAALATGKPPKMKAKKRKAKK